MGPLVGRAFAPKKCQALSKCISHSASGLVNDSSAWRKGKM